MQLPEELARVVGDLDFEPDEIDRRYESERGRRMGPERFAQLEEGTDRFKAYSRDPWVDPDFTRPAITDHTEVIVNGGGWGGLLVGARLHDAGVTDIRIIDEAGDFGGTWYWNRYPGAMCDTEAHMYLPLLEETNYAPKHRYSYAPEIAEHARRIGRKYGLYNKACFQTMITDAVWIDEESRWLVTTDRGDRMTANYLVLACGRQARPKLPAIPGIEDFSGRMFHSSRWDYNYTGGDTAGNLTGLAGKAVGIVGTGASAIQVIPEVAKWARHLYVFQRTPSAVSSRDQRETGPNWVDRSQPGWQRRRQENFQANIVGERPATDDVHDGWTAISAALSIYSPESVAPVLGRQPSPQEMAFLAKIADHRVMNEIRARCSKIVKDAATARLLTPWYRFRCKRPCYHDGYYETYNRDNVDLVDTSSGIERITSAGIVVGGRAYPLDCLIFATGFEHGITYTQLIGFDPTGRGNVKLSEHWADGTRSLHGMMTDRFPNLTFVFLNRHLSPTTNATHLLDEEANHIAHLISSTRAKNASAFEPTSDAVDAYTRHIAESPGGQSLEFYQQCTPGYFNAEGTATKNEDLYFAGRFGEGPRAYFAMLKAWRNAGDFPELEYRDSTKADIS
jgi:cation diffusion facilitator CzcD-associated flavoprotein CzcO